MVELEVGKLEGLVKEALFSGLEPMKILGALRSGMEEIGRRFENSEYFVSELIMAGELIKNALSLLKPHLKAEAGSEGKIVLGTIIADLHDIGKEIKPLLISPLITRHSASWVSKRCERRG